MGIVAHVNGNLFIIEQSAQTAVDRTDYGNDVWQCAFQCAQRSNCNWGTVRQRVQQLVCAEAAGAARGEQDADGRQDKRTGDAGSVLTYPNSNS